MIFEESLPGLRGRFAVPRQQPRNGALRDLDTEFQEFSVDARCSPERVGGGHLPDQSSNLGTDLWATDALRSRKPGPEEPKALAMPGHHRLRFHDNQGPAPVLPGVG